MAKIVNKRELAEILGASERALTTWQKAGMPVLVGGARGEGNEYDTAAVIRWLLARRAGRKSQSPRDRVAARQAELLDIELAQKRGELVSREEIRPAWLELIASAKQALRALPAGLAPLLEQMAGVDAKRDLLEEAINEVLAKLAADEETEIGTEPSDARARPRGARNMGAAAAGAAVRLGRTASPNAGGLGDPGAISVRSDALPPRGS